MSTSRKPDPAKKAKTDPAAYEKYKAQQAAISRERSEAGRDIGPLPPVKDAARKESCRDSLRLFCETYLHSRFWMGWSADHLKVIAKLEAAILKGGLFALAMPRGSGKTTLAEAAALWAILYGHRRFAVLIGATDEAACEMLDSIKIAVETIDELDEDFPEACYPIRRMEGINNRAGGQTLNGKRTRVAWTAKEANFPTVAGSKCSGAVICVTGITGRVRGMKAATADGKIIRPDLAIADDPQTDDSAVSLPEITKREKKLRGAVKGLAGPGKSIAMVVPCTVIASRDLSDRILDRERNPQFQGERMKMLYSFPTKMERWEEYADLRRDWYNADKVGDGHNAYYRVHREEMDAGAVVAWPERFDPELEVSGIQAAMNLWIDNRREFLAEYQNEPQDDERAAGAKRMQAEGIVQRLSGLERFAIPRESARITAFIDVGGELLWSGIAAWDARFGGSLIDYGEFPRQSRRVFEANDVGRSGLAVKFPGLSESERVYAGLAELVGLIAGREYYREGTGEAMRVERILIDAGWQAATVYKFCRQSHYSSILYPSKGIGRTTTARGVSEWKPRAGERSGYHWRLTMSETGSGRMVQFDPDAWKTFLHERMTCGMGGAGAFTLYGKEPGEHEQLAAHLAAEYAEPLTLRGATFDKWAMLPGQTDNHLLDVLVGCCVAASVQGLVWSPGSPIATAEAKRTFRKHSDVQREKLTRAAS